MVSHRPGPHTASPEPPGAPGAAKTAPPKSESIMPASSRPLERSNRYGPTMLPSPSVPNVNVIIASLSAALILSGMVPVAVKENEVRAAV